MDNIDINPTIVFKIADNVPILGGMGIPNTLITGLIASGILIILALLVRFLLLGKFKDIPKGMQNIVELIVESMQNYTNSKVGETAGAALGPYFFTLVAYVGCNGLLELVGVDKLRTSPSDLNQTVVFALVTFILIRALAYRKKGVLGRLKYYITPSPVIAPVKFFVDLAIPVSLACRMFGNLLGGFVVMTLLYTSIPWIVPAFASTYFTIFHTGMQAFIFITLSLAFIEEALE